MTEQEIIAQMDEVQRAHTVWQNANFKPQPYHRLLWGMVEEMGELFHSSLKSAQNIRKTPAQHLSDAIDALGDIGIYSIGFCTSLGIPYSEAVAPRAINLAALKLKGMEDTFFAEGDRESKHGLEETPRTIRRLKSVVISMGHLVSSTFDSIQERKLAFSDFIRSVDNLSRHVSGYGVWYHTFNTWESVVSKRDWVANPMTGGEHTHETVADII